MFWKKEAPVELKQNKWGSYIKVPDDGFFWNKHNTYFVLGAADDLDLSEDGIFCNTFENYPVDRMKVRVMSSDIYPQFMIMEISVKNAAVAIFEEGLEKLLYRLNFKIPGYKEGSAAFWGNVYDEAAVCDSAEKE